MSAAARRGWHLLQLQLAEVVHQRVAWGVVLAGAALVLLAGVLRDLNFGAAESHFLLSAARVILGLAGTVLVALLGPMLVGQGVSRRMAPVLFTRGARRSEWVLASAGALVIAVAWLAAVLAIALAGVLARNGHFEQVPMAWRGLAAGTLPLLILAGAAVFFSCIFERPVPASAATLALAGASQLAPVLDHLRDQGGAIGVLARVLDWLVPDFAFLSGAPAGLAVAYSLGFTALYAIAAVLTFSRREL